MVSFGEKAKIKKAGNLNQGRSYVITTEKNIQAAAYNGARTVYRGCTAGAGHGTASLKILSFL